MSTLNHVSIWTEHGWKHITAEEASRKYLRTTVPANSGIFMCELCGQYVTFTVDNYFMHSRGYSDKSCDERTHYDGYSYSSQAWEYHLPMRLLSYEDRFHLEVGFPPVPPTMLKANQNNTISIKVWTDYTRIRFVIWKLTVYPQTDTCWNTHLLFQNTGRIRWRESIQSEHCFHAIQRASPGRESLQCQT